MSLSIERTNVHPFLHGEHGRSSRTSLEGKVGRCPARCGSSGRLGAAPEAKGWLSSSRLFLAQFLTPVLNGGGGSCPAPGTEADLGAPATRYAVKAPRQGVAKCTLAPPEVPCPDGRVLQPIEIYGGG